MSIKNPATGGFLFGILSNCLCVYVWRIILNIMKYINSLLFILCVLSSRVALAFPDGLSVGLGMSALGGVDIVAGYKYTGGDSWRDKFAVRFDFADVAPLKSAIDSAIGHIMDGGVDVGDGVKIDNGQLDSLHYGALIDFYPFDSAWRISGGMMWGRMELDADIVGEIAEIPSERFYFYINGDHYYYNGNRFRGNASIDWNFYGPYFGTGFDIGLGCGFVLFLDAGIVLANRPARLNIEIPHEQLYIYDVAAATWAPVTVPKLDSDVAAAERDANHKLSDLRVYPVVKLGVLYRF